MSVVRIVTQEEAPPAPVTTADTSVMKIWTYLGVTMVLLAMIGTWLVWFSLRWFNGTFRRRIFERPASEPCRTADRYFDTVIIQREDVRR